MKKHLCRVLRDSNSRIFVVSDRLTTVSEGDYILDEKGTAFILFSGYHIPVEGVSDCPVGDLMKIEGTDHPLIKVNRLTPEFRAVVKDSTNIVDKVFIKIRNKTNHPQTDERGFIMVKNALLC